MKKFFGIVSFAELLVKNTSDRFSHFWFACSIRINILLQFEMVCPVHMHPMSYSRILIMPHILLGQVNLVHIKSFIIVLYCYCITLSMLAKSPVHLYTSRFFYWKVAKSEEPKICYYWLGGCFLEMAI